MEQQLYVLERNCALEHLVARFNPAERREMEEDIKINGAQRSVKIWGETILIDYEYYDYCHEHKIPFSVERVPLRTEAEAVAWVSKNQLDRKSLSEERRKYLIGRRSRAERENILQQLQKQGDSTGLQAMVDPQYAKHSISKSFVRERIGKEYSLVYMTIRKYENYAESLDIIYKFCQDFVNEHLAGRLKVSIEKIEVLASLSPDMIVKECKRRMQDAREHGYNADRRGYSKDNEKKEETATVSIKDMPAYDPDAEIVSLSLTIPSWRSSIFRVRDVSNIRKTTGEARLRLKKELIRLKSATDKLIYVLREDFDG